MVAASAVAVVCVIAAAVRPDDGEDGVHHCARYGVRRRNNADGADGHAGDGGGEAVAQRRVHAHAGRAARRRARLTGTCR